MLRTLRGGRPVSQSISSESNDPAERSRSAEERARDERRQKKIDAVMITIFFVILFIAWIPGGHPPEASHRNQCRNNLKQIGLALHNYHDMYGSFPPAFVTSDDGRPMHSWRVLILPFLDRKHLYEQYRFDEPWDGPSNQKLAGKIGDVFRCPSDKAGASASRASFTNFVAVAGPQTAWPGVTPTRIKDFADGASNSILVVEVADSGIHWMEPRDLHVLQMSRTVSSRDGQGISSAHAHGAHVLLADGAVRFVSEELPVETIRALLTINGGEPVPNY